MVFQFFVCVGLENVLQRTHFTFAVKQQGENKKATSSNFFSRNCKTYREDHSINPVFVNSSPPALCLWGPPGKNGFTFLKGRKVKNSIARHTKSTCNAWDQGVVIINTFEPNIT